MIKALKIRNGGWLVVPAKFLQDAGLHYDLDFRMVRRRVYKSSIDKEFEFGLLTGLVAMIIWGCFKLVWVFVALVLRLTRMFLPRL